MKYRDHPTLVWWLRHLPDVIFVALTTALFILGLAYVFPA